MAQEDTLEMLRKDFRGKEEIFELNVFMFRRAFLVSFLFILCKNICRRTDILCRV